MKGLLIEDDPAKANKIFAVLAEGFPDLEISLEISYQSGLQAIFKKDFDFILLDMSLPTYDQDGGNFSGKPKNFGGSAILKEMRRYGKHSVVKVITQYNEFDGGLISTKELHEELRKTYPMLYHGYIIFNAQQTAWTEELTQFVRALLK